MSLTWNCQQITWLKLAQQFYIHFLFWNSGGGSTLLHGKASLNTSAAQSKEHIILVGAKK